MISVLQRFFQFLNIFICLEGEGELNPKNRLLHSLFLEKQR